MIGTALCAEDEVILALETAEALRSAGFENVVVVHDLASAMSCAEKAVPDVAVLDVNLAGSSSIGFGRWLASQGCRVVFVSGYERAEIDSGAQNVEFLQKPCSAAAIAGLLGSRPA